MPVRVHEVVLQNVVCVLQMPLCSPPNLLGNPLSFFLIGGWMAVAVAVDAVGWMRDVGVMAIAPDLEA